MANEKHKDETYVPESFTPEQAEQEEEAMGTYAEGDSATTDDRVGTLKHVEDMPEMEPEGIKPAKLEDILRKEREARENGAK